MRLAVVGCGDAARAVGLASRFVRRCRIVAAADPDARRRDRFARAHGAAGYGDWREVLNAGNVDAVYVAVPHDLHRGIALAFADRGMGVLLEKPVAASLADSERLADEQPAGAKIAVNYQYRYDPLIARMLGAADRLGSLLYTQVIVPWYRSADYFREAAWHASAARSGGGTLLTQGSHGLDIALCVGGPPVRATARVFHRLHTSSETEDLASAIVETGSGAPVFITSSMVSRPGAQVSIAMYGSSGSLIYHGPQRARLRAYRVRVGRSIVLTQLHPYVASVAGFRDWVEGGPPHRCTVADALPVMRAIDGAYRSARTGMSAEIPSVSG